MPRFPLYYLFTICFYFYATAKDLPIINIPNQGNIVARELSKIRVQKIFGYYGIPYARPPLAELRFAPPVTDPLPSWDGVRNITNYKPACLQTIEDFREEDLPFFKLITNTTDIEVNEDCLYLNVFVPHGNVPADGFATIIWLHPGNFTTGSPSYWNPHTLVYRQRVIIVTVAWRVSILGFFTTMDGEAPGNFGLMDQQAAMAWVKNNIKLFGGNPNNICLMGYGTGGTSVGLHMINTESKDLFSKAIIMSSNFPSPTEVKNVTEDKKFLDQLARTFGCVRNPTSQMIDCLRRAEGIDLVQQTSNINWRPVIDIGLSNSSLPFLPDYPSAYFGRGDFHKVPFLTGYTNMEEVLGIKSLDSKNLNENSTNEFLQQILRDIVNADAPNFNNSESNCGNNEHISDAVMFFYGPAGPISDSKEIRKIIADFTTDKNYAASTYLLATYVSKHQPTYMYRFDMKPVTPSAVEQIPEWVTVPHLFDLIYVWGVPYWKPLDDQQWDFRDKRISDTIMSFWTNFAKSSDPTKGSIYPITWDPFKEETPGILIIDGTFNMSNSKNLNYKAFEFWNDYYPKVVKVASQCCASAESGSTRYFIYSPFLILPLYYISYLY